MLVFILMTTTVLTMVVMIMNIIATTLPSSPSFPSPRRHQGDQHHLHETHDQHRHYRALNAPVEVDTKAFMVVGVVLQLSLPAAALAAAAPALTFAPGDRIAPGFC